MHPHALWYSADPACTIGQLKKGDYVFSGDSDSIADRCDSHGVQAFVIGSEQSHYKVPLITSAPYILYCMGDVGLLDRSILAIVGPRAMTGYAEQVVNHIFDLLPGYDVVTISGGADGVDLLTHQLSMQNNIPTILVLGGGLRRYWQSARQPFMQKIIDNGGLIISEFKLDMKPTNYSFPQRNRIVAGLADVVCVPEASVGSGSLITVDFAVAMRKPVYGSPGSIFSPQSAGLHTYISSGKVTLLYDASVMFSDHFSSRDVQEVHIPTTINLDPLQQQILQLCLHNDMTLDGLIQETSSDMTKILECLTILEMYGLVLQGSPGQYRSTQKIAK